MSFAAQLAPKPSLVMDWFTRHPALDRITLHVEGLEAESVPVASLPMTVQSLIAQLDAALAQVVAAQSGLPCTPAQPVPVVLPVE